MTVRVAYLTMSDPGDFVTDYDLSYAAMAEHGLEAVPVPWRDRDIDWDSFAAVYICTPWDYPDHKAEFVAVLERIDRSRALLVNDLALVRWNLEKTYLRDVEGRGAAIVPSLWCDAFEATDIPAWFEALGADRLVVKPVVGANAQYTYVIDGAIDTRLGRELAATFGERPFFVQPFIASVQAEGEFSLFFFGGAYSHAIRKVPARGDFRCQEEHGATILRHDAPTALVAAAQKILVDIRPEPVYVRIDFVLDAAGRPLLMELELVEPALYLRMDPRAADRFAAAFAEHLARSKHG